MASLGLVRAIFSIVVINLVLSGDNAVVIGLASRQLEAAQRSRAIVLGAAGAIGLRIIFTTLAALLLGVPLLQAGGGVLLVWIAYKLLRQGEGERAVREGANLFDAVRTIILADVIMSLDNILAVGGAANGDLPLLIFGLVLSMPIIIFGGNLVAVLMNHLPWLVYAGSAILTYTAGQMIFEDRIVGRVLPDARWAEWAFTIVLTAGVLGLGYWQNARQASAVAAEKATRAVTHSVACGGRVASESHQAD